MSRIILTLLLISLFTNIFSQTPDKEYFRKNLEVYFEFNISDRSELEELTRIISLDNVDNKLVRAYANEEEWNQFIKLGYKYKILPHPGDAEGIIMSSDLKSIRGWDVYPTYDAYIQMMYQFAANYPNLCRIVDAGNSVNGRKLLFAVISDNVNIKEAEPQFMYSSTMHGDETTGYVLMLRLIDSLLTSYGTDPRITHLVNNVEIWINPNANPDGTYYGGNHTVASARRANANGIDLNRNFPTPAGSPTGSRQVETQAMITLADNNNFVLSANIHGGAEVINYPWDSFLRLHPDNNWLVQISRKYADTAQANSPSGYLTYLNNGITNGYAWYPVYGGRQDFFTYHKRGREVTIEISNTKNPSASQLPAFWNYNRLSFLSYIENTLYGIRGLVTDLNGNPVKALVKITGHDMDSSEIYSDYRTGNYHRMLSPGTYSLTFSAPGYVTRTINNISVSLNNTTFVDVQLYTGTFQLTTTVNDGWNLVAIPGLHPVNQQVNTWWQYRDPMTNVFWYSNSYEIVNELVPGKGYFLRHNGNYTYNTGDEWPAGGIIIVPNNPINGNAGWNMIGGYNYNAAVSGITTVPPGVIESSFFSFSGSYTTATHLLPGSGYWVKLSQAAQIHLPGALYRESSVKSNLIDDSWGRIIFSDKSGKNYILYAAGSDADLKKYELPPVISEEMYDIRYDSQRYVEHINNSFQGISLKGIAYPLTIKTENISIIIQDEAVSGINRTIIPGEEIMISNKDISRLMVSAAFTPDDYSLEQNYPNPFNPATNIGFTIPEDAEVSVTIYNSLGQKVSELVNGSLKAGFYNYTWNSENNASGIYIYQLRTNNYLSTKKMLLVK
jgi:hypothetical protein